MTTEIEDAAAKRVARVRRLQDTVAILLRYNSEAACKSTPDDLIQAVTPMLRTPADEIDDDGEIVLWQGCDRLTQMISPTTLESAKLAIELADWDTTGNRKALLPSAAHVHCRKKWWIWGAIGCLAIYIVAQSGAVVLGRAMEDLKGYQAQIAEIDQQKALGKTAGQDFIDGLDARRVTAEAGLLAAQRTITTLLWIPAPVTDDGGTGFTDGATIRAQLGAPRATETYGRIFLDVLQGYLVPVLLGTIGALAFVIREFSWNVTNHAYRAVSAIRDQVRIVQGATFGALAGILVNALGGEVKGGELSIPLVALLFGYSSDIAFKAADQLISRFKNAIKSPAPADKPKQPTNAARPPDDDGEGGTTTKRQTRENLERVKGIEPSS